MTAQQKVREYLIAHPGRQYCDDCLSVVLQVRPRQQVQQKTSELAQQPSFRRAAGTCSRCHSNKVVIEAVAGAKHTRPKARASIEPLPSAQLLFGAATTKEKPIHTAAERRYGETIRAKDHALRTFLKDNRLADGMDGRQWLLYLTGIKHALGNINNNVGFVATLLVKQYLEDRFAISDFDAAGKAQGAPGIDVQAKTADGKTIAGELKTTKPYQPGFGAAQRTTILKDLAKLSNTAADYRFMFVVEPDAFEALRGKSFASRAPGVEVVDLVTGRTFVCPASRGDMEGSSTRCN